MNLQVFGRKSCRETQKGVRWLKERRIEFHYLDIDQKAPSKGELTSIANSCGWENLLDTQGSFYQKKGYAHLQYDLPTELLEHPELIKTPIFRSGPKAVCGFVEGEWKKLI
jgi:arsenate reductase